MEKKDLQLLINQYFKSFKRFESAYSYMSKSNFKILIKGFNSDFSNLISTVLNGDADQIYSNLHESLIYSWATDNEQMTLSEELYWKAVRQSHTNH